MIFDNQIYCIARYLEVLFLQSDEQEPRQSLNAALKNDMNDNLESLSIMILNSMIPFFTDKVSIAATEQEYQSVIKLFESEYNAVFSDTGFYGVTAFKSILEYLWLLRKHSMMVKQGLELILQSFDNPKFTIINKYVYTHCLNKFIFAHATNSDEDIKVLTLLLAKVDSVSDVIISEENRPCFLKY